MVTAQSDRRVTRGSGKCCALKTPSRPRRRATAEWRRTAVSICLAAALLFSSSTPAAAQNNYIGFDKNSYPGDDLLLALHQTFAYTGYWLNNPPGMNSNPWAGKRSVARAVGFGFLILFNGRLDAQLKDRNAAELGRQDAATAVAAARREGFPAGAILFLDQEEGGSLLPEQAAYMGAWISAISRSAYKAGVYCSGIPAPSGPKMISTAQDIVTRFPTTKLWIWEDRCPPSPGCVVPPSLDPAKSGFPQVLVWQYAQSPRRPENTAACAQTYAADNRCYAPGLPHSDPPFIDLNTSRSPDPSHGR